MPIFAIFVFASVVFGAGAMLSPALPTRSPRIGLAAALALGFVVSGAIFWAALFGWNTLVIDYLWFALIVGIFLTGTLSAGMFRAEASGLKEYSGWPGPHELAFFLTVAILFAVPALVLPVPLNTEGQSLGYIALMLRFGGNLTTLALYHPEISYLYSPGVSLLAAYLSQQLNSGLHTIELGLGAVLPVLFAWVAYDFGNEIAPDESRHLGIAMSFCAVIGMTLLIPASHYAAMLALIFTLACLTFIIRFYRDGHRGDFIAAAVTLACVPLSQPTMTFIVLAYYVLGLIVIAVLHAPHPLPPLRIRRGGGSSLINAQSAPGGEVSKSLLTRWLLMALGVPGLAILGLLPWLVKIAPLLGDLHSALAIDDAGLVLFLILFIPVLYLAATGLIALRDRIGRERATGWLRSASLPIMIVLIILAGLMMGHPDLADSVSHSIPLPIYGALATQDDVQAMNWLAENTPKDALILNYPGPYEADWVPMIAQRNTVYFPSEPFYHGTEQAAAMQNALRAFWDHLGDPSNEALLKQYGIQYVIVPQFYNQPGPFAFRWQPPIVDSATYGTFPKGKMPYLELVADFNGAQVYKYNGGG